MTYAIKYHPEVIDDLQQLGGNVRKQVFKKGDVGTTLVVALQGGSPY